MNRREFLKKGLEGIVIGSIPLISGCLKNPVGSNFSQSYYYYYNDKKIYLTPNLSKYTVKFKDEMTDDRKRKILSKYFSTYNLSWYIYLNLIRFNTNTIDYKKILESIPEIEFVSYAFIMEDFELYLFNRFNAQFKPEVSIEEINSFNANYNAKIIGKYDFGQYGITYRLEILWNSPLNALELSNIYHESDLVEHASPNFGGGGREHQQ